MLLYIHTYMYVYILVFALGSKIPSYGLRYIFYHG